VRLCAGRSSVRYALRRRRLSCPLPSFRRAQV
jgi:hypothetical protein